ncbi:MAG: hypothetical protein JWN80_156 [Microbacteriaceae bacterium]|nr:hypothetical protein [Microbacteriaceae bacterium]
MSPSPRPLPPPLRGRPFTAQEAQTLGVSAGRLRGRDLGAPFFGVRASATEPLDTAGKALAYATRMPSGHFFSHWTAAELWGLRLPESRQTGERIDVSVLHPGRAPRSRRVIGHQVSVGAELRLHPEGLRMTSPRETWCQLADSLTLDELIAMGDGLVRRKRPLCTMDDLESAVAARSHYPGIVMLRKALPHIRPRTDSWRETLLRLMIVRAGFPEPEVNGLILNQFGSRIGHGDLVYRRERILLEYDGRQHWEDDKQFSVDIERLDYFMADGWRVIRVDKALMARPAALFAKLRAAFATAKPIS